MDAAQSDQSNSSAALLTSALQQFLVISPEEVEELQEADSEDTLPRSLALLRAVHAQHAYKVKSTDAGVATATESYPTINVVLLGKARTGKTTLLDRILKSPCFVAEASALFARPTQARLEQFTIEAPAGLSYNVRILDTAGLYDRVIKSSESPTDTLATELVAECAKHGMTQVHACLFVCSRMSARLVPIDVTALATLNNSSGFQATPFSLVITSSESLAPHKRADYEAELRQHHNRPTSSQDATSSTPSTSLSSTDKLFENERVRVLFSGALTNDDFALFCPDELKDKLSNIVRMRDALFAHVISQSS